MYRTHANRVAALAAGLPPPRVNQSTSPGTLAGANARRARNRGRKRAAAKGQPVIYWSNPFHPHCRETRVVQRARGTYGSEPAATVEVIDDQDEVETTDK